VFFQTTDNASHLAGDYLRLHADRYVRRRNRKTLNMTDGVPGSLACVVIGGYPPPSVTIQLDSVDITEYFHVSQSAMLHGTTGLRTITHTSKRSNSSPLCVAYVLAAWITG